MAVKKNLLFNTIHYLFYFLEVVHNTISYLEPIAWSKINHIEHRNHQTTEDRSVVENT